MDMSNGQKSMKIISERNDFILDQCAMESLVTQNSSATAEFSAILRVQLLMSDDLFIPELSTCI